MKPKKSFRHHFVSLLHFLVFLFRADPSLLRKTAPIKYVGTGHGAKYVQGQRIIKIILLLLLK
jgi:hypothetical protein